MQTSFCIISLALSYNLWNVSFHILSIFTNISLLNGSYISALARKYLLKYFMIPKMNVILFWIWYWHFCKHVQLSRVWLHTMSRDDLFKQRDLYVPEMFLVFVKL